VVSSGRPEDKMSNVSKYNRLRKAVYAATQQLGTERTQLLQDVLDRVVFHVLNKYQERLGVGIQDSVADLIANFKHKVSQEIFDVAHGWVLSTRHDKHLFPPNCRFLYKIGRYTVAVIEETPAVRQLDFDLCLLEGDEHSGSRYVGGHVPLAIPYSVFVLTFNEDSYMTSMRYGWRTAPLSGFNDMVNKPFLPNINDIGSVCLGDFQPTANGISAKTTEAVDFFWTSRFNNDYRHFWWERTGTYSSIQEWKSRSGADPLFVLHEPTPELMTLEQFIKAATGEAQTFDLAALRSQLTERLNGFFDQLHQGMTRYFKKTKFEKLYPKDVVDELGESLTIIFDEVMSTVSSLEEEIGAMSQEIDRDTARHYARKPKNSFWSYWTNYASQQS
jgi:hypothetical protein